MGTADPLSMQEGQSEASACLSQETRLPPSDGDVQNRSSSGPIDSDGDHDMGMTEIDSHQPPLVPEKVQPKEVQSREIQWKDMQQKDVQQKEVQPRPEPPLMGQEDTKQEISKGKKSEKDPKPKDGRRDRGVEQAPKMTAILPTRGSSGEQLPANFTPLGEEHNDANADPLKPPGTFPDGTAGGTSKKGRVTASAYTQTSQPVQSTPREPQRPQSALAGSQGKWSNWGFGSSNSGGRRADRIVCSPCEDCYHELLGIESMLDGLVAPYETKSEHRRVSYLVQSRRSFEKIMHRCCDRVTSVVGICNHERQNQAQMEKRIMEQDNQRTQIDEFCAQMEAEYLKKLNDKDVQIRKMTRMIDMLQKGGLPLHEDDHALMDAFDRILTDLRSWARYAAKGVSTPMTYEDYASLDANSQKLLRMSITNIGDILQRNNSTILRTRCMEILLSRVLIHEKVIGGVIGLTQELHSYLDSFQNHGQNMKIQCTAKELHHWRALSINLLTKSNSFFATLQATAIDEVTDSLIGRLAPLGAPGAADRSKLRKIVAAAAELSLTVAQLPFKLISCKPTAKKFTESLMADIVGVEDEADLAEHDYTVLLCPAVLKYKFDEAGSYDIRKYSSVFMRAPVSCEPFD